MKCDLCYRTKVWADFLQRGMMHLGISGYFRSVTEDPLLDETCIGMYVPNAIYFNYVHGLVSAANKAVRQLTKYPLIKVLVVSLIDTRIKEYNHTINFTLADLDSLLDNLEYFIEQQLEGYAASTGKLSKKLSIGEN